MAFGGLAISEKKDGEPRGVIDYRGLNEKTVVDAYKLPHISDILERQGRRHIWSVIDLKDAFSQIPLHRDSRPLAAEATPIGVLQPRCMPQGLKNSLAIEWVLHGVRDVCDPYIDDPIGGTCMQSGMNESEVIA